MSENNLEKIVLHYEDGSCKETKKGFICQMTPDTENDETHFVFEMVNISGAEIENIVYGIIEMGKRIGMFDEKIEDEVI